MAEVWLWPVALGVLGAIFGSFIATVALRWPEGRSPLAGRSMCDQCGRTLDVWELVPIASFVALGARCRTCGGRIGAMHPACEIAGLAIGVAAGLAAPGIEGVAGALFGWLLLQLAALDAAAFWLPNPLTAALAALGLATALVIPEPALIDRLAGGAAGYAALAIVAAVYARLRGRMGLGGGDAKLLGAIGLWLGWRALPGILLIASVAGLIGVLALRLAGREVKATDRVPLGALLAGAAFLWWVAGAVDLNDPGIG